MNVRELREALQALEAQGQGAMDVKFSYNYGDHWSTQVAADIDTIETGLVKYSEYHGMDKVDDSEEEDFSPEDTRCVVLLG